MAGFIWVNAGDQATTKAPVPLCGGFDTAGLRAQQWSVYNRSRFERRLKGFGMTRSVSRRDFLSLLAGTALVAASGCAGNGADKGSAAGSAAGAGDDIKGAKLTFVGDDAFAPYRYLETQSDGKQKVVGLDIAIADEMASRLGFPALWRSTICLLSSSVKCFGLGPVEAEPPVRLG